MLVVFGVKLAPPPEGTNEVLVALKFVGLKSATLAFITIAGASLYLGGIPLRTNGSKR